MPTIQASREVGMHKKEDISNKTQKGTVPLTNAAQHLVLYELIAHHRRRLRQPISCDKLVKKEGG